jgi:hypothetical protein
MSKISLYFNHILTHIIKPVKRKRVENLERKRFKKKEKANAIWKRRVVLSDLPCF